VFRTPTRQDNVLTDGPGVLEEGEKGVAVQSTPRLTCLSLKIQELTAPRRDRATNGGSSKRRRAESLPISAAFATSTYIL